MAAVVASFTDQQQHAQSIPRFLFEQVHRRVDRIQNYRATIPRLQIPQIVFHQARILRKVPDDFNLAVELHHRNSSSSESE